MKVQEKYNSPSQKVTSHLLPSDQIEQQQPAENEDKLNVLSQQDSGFMSHEDPHSKSNSRTVDKKATLANFSKSHRKETNPIPSQMTLVEYDKKENVKTVQEISNVLELAKNVTIFRLPNQIASSLSNSILKHYISLNPSGI